MARPLKVGIDYFPTDVDIDQDDKVVMVKNKYGLMGMGTVMMLLARVYKTGYYYHWTEREQELFAGHFGEEVNVINNVVNECIKWGFFDKTKFSEHEILTSKGIQKRYLLAVERRKDKHINADYWLLEKEDYDDINLVNVNNNSVNEDNNPVNASKSTQSKVNRNKSTLKEYIQLEDMPHVKITKKEHDKLITLLGSEEKLNSKLYYFASWILTQPKKKQETASPYLSIAAWHKRDLEKQPTPIVSNNRTSIPERYKKIENDPESDAFMEKVYGGLKNAVTRTT